EQNAAALGAVEPRETIEERGLSRAVRADEAANLALTHVEGDAVERHDAAEAHREVAHPDKRARLGRRSHWEHRHDVSRPRRTRAASWFFGLLTRTRSLP